MDTKQDKGEGSKATCDSVGPGSENTAPQALIRLEPAPSQGLCSPYYLDHKGLRVERLSDLPDKIQDAW